MNKEINVNDLIGKLIMLKGTWIFRNMNFEKIPNRKDSIVYVESFVVEPLSDTDSEKAKSFIIIDSDCKEIITRIRSHDDVEILS